MKQGIHPNWHDDCKVSCTCGNAFTTGSVLEAIEVDICSQCHPFFTGEMKFVDRQGRVDKFLAKQKKAMAAKAQNKKKAKSDDKQQTAKSYHDILREQQRELSKKNKVVN